MIMDRLQVNSSSFGEQRVEERLQRDRQISDDDDNGRTTKKKKKELGGIRTMPFILVNEICDRFASAGFHANMITYLTQVLNLPLVRASNTLTNFGGTASFTSLIGALIADSFAGRYWTIVAGSLFYQLGMVSLTLSALLPSLRPPPCPTQTNCIEASSKQLWVLYISLLLTSIGSGGIRPCVVTFAADQFDMTKAKVEARGWNYFNVYFFCMGVASLLAITVVVYIQDNVGWGLGLGIPTATWVVALVIFLLGSPLYKRVKAGGSPLVRLAQVIVAAHRKRKMVAPDDPGLLYENKELDALITTTGRLVHTQQFKWLDKAAIVSEEESTNTNKPLNLWRQSTVHRVEELKSIIRMLPIWASGILLVTSSSHLGSFTLQQARSMNRHLSSSFQISPANLSVFSILTCLVGIVLYERLFVPIVRRFTRIPVGITCLQRMGVGFVINIIATVVSGLVEVKRKSAASRYGLLDRPAAVIPISVFWLVPQYCLHGLADVFMSVGHMEFLYDQSPESMRSTAAALYWLSISGGNYLGTAVVTLVHRYTGKEANWLPDRNLNRGRLENYYWLVTVIQAVNFIYYVVCAWLYTYKPVDESTVTAAGEEGDQELGKVPEGKGDYGGMSTVNGEV